MSSPGDVRAGGAYVEISTKMNVKKGLDQLRKQLQSTAKEVAKIAAGIAAFGALATKGFLLAAETAGNEQKAIAQLNQTLVTTGGILGYTTKQIVAMADSLKSLTAYSREEILITQALVATFTNISREVFPDTVEQILNMSQALNVSLKQATIQVGKALNDPITGVDSLRESGVSLNAQQKELIRTLAMTGRVMDAQKIILKELSIEFGEQARMFARTYTGSVLKARVALKDLTICIGNALLPTLYKLNVAFVRIAVPVRKWLDENKGLILSAFKITAAITGIAASVAVLAAGLVILLHPIGFAIAMLTAIGAAGLIAFTDIEDGLAGLVVSFSVFGKTLQQWAMTITISLRGVFFAFVDEVWQIATTWFRDLFDFSVKYIERFARLLRAVFPGLKDDLDGIVEKFSKIEKMKDPLGDYFKKRVQREADTLDAFNVEVANQNKRKGVFDITDFIKKAFDNIPKFEGMGYAPGGDLGALGGVPSGGVGGFFGGAAAGEQIGAFAGNKQTSILSSIRELSRQQVGTLHMIERRLYDSGRKTVGNSIYG